MQASAKRTTRIPVRGPRVAKAPGAGQHLDAKLRRLRVVWLGVEDGGAEEAGDLICRAIGMRGSAEKLDPPEGRVCHHRRVTVEKRVRAEGDEDVGRVLELDRAVKARGGDADDREWSAVEVDRPADGGRIAAEARAPEPVAQNRDRRRARTVVRIAEEPSRGGPDLEESKEVPGYGVPGGHERAVADRGADALDRGERREIADLVRLVLKCPPGGNRERRARRAAGVVE
jgi:hypothetical protein